MWWNRLGWLPIGLTLGWILAGILALPLGGLPEEVSFSNTWLYHLAAIVCAAVCLTATGKRRHRIGWTLVFLGCLSWICADLYFLELPLSMAVSLSLADLGFIAFYPLVGAGILLLRDGPPVAAKSPWSRRALVIRVIDGSAVALAISSMAASVTFDQIAAAYQGDPEGTIINVAYPVLSSVLLSLVVVSLAVYEWSTYRHWWLLSAGILTFWLADTAFAASAAGGTYSSGLPLDAGWLATFALFGAAATAKARPARRRRQTSGWRQVVVPSLFALVTFVIAVMMVFERVNLVASTLAVLTMFAVLVRQVLTLVDHHLLIATVRQEARTDALTGLANRRALFDDLQEQLVTAQQNPFALALFDLDGFKQFNDCFGHPAGDTLLARRAQALQDTPGIERAYRLGGDEYCVIVPIGRGEDWRGTVEACADALGEEGPDYRIGSSWGCALVPEEAQTISQVMQQADRRLYANKGDRRSRAAGVPNQRPSAERAQPAARL